MAEVLTLADVMHDLRTTADKYNAEHGTDYSYSCFSDLPYFNVENDIPEIMQAAFHISDEPCRDDNVHAPCRCYAIDWETLTYTFMGEHEKWQCPIKVASMDINPDGVVIQE